MINMLSFGSLISEMEGLRRVFWIIALAASLVFIIQTVITFIGLGTDMDVDAGPDSMDGLGDSVEDGSLSGKELYAAWTSNGSVLVNITLDGAGVIV
ncbi:MAG: hypothetical protein IKS24_10105, partial [Bacteroidaceae bacterium]|nr:hypothetical protein [Bacteroidaceae bacterium]